MKVGNLRGAQRNLFDATRMDPNAPLLAETVKLWNKADDATRPSIASSQPGATQPATASATTARAITPPSP